MVLHSHPLVVCPTPSIDGILQGQAERIAESNYRAEARAGTFLEQRDETAGWDMLGVPAVSGFLSWLRIGRTVEHSIARDAETTPSAETLEARLAALISSYRWHGAV